MPRATPPASASRSAWPSCMLACTTSRRRRCTTCASEHQDPPPPPLPLLAACGPHGGMSPCDLSGCGSALLRDLNISLTYGGLVFAISDIGEIIASFGECAVGSWDEEMSGPYHRRWQRKSALICRPDCLTAASFCQATPSGLTTTTSTRSCSAPAVACWAARSPASDSSYPLEAFLCTSQAASLSEQVHNGLT